MEAKHVQKLGVRMAYYLLLLQWANWDTGKVLFYRDQDVADKFEMPLRTIREWRKQLEKDGYISCLQKKDHQEITIKKWKNPRGKGDINPLPSEIEDDINMSPSDDFDAEGYIKGYIKGGLKHVTLPCSSDNRYQNNKNKEIKLLSPDENKQFNAIFRTFYGDVFRGSNLNLFEKSAKYRDENSIKIFIAEDSNRKMMNRLAAQMNPILKERFSNGILDFESIEFVQDQQSSKTTEERRKNETD